MIKKISRLLPEKIKNQQKTNFTQILLKSPLANIIGINTLQIEITKKCNLRCEMCKGSLKKRPGKKKDKNINISPTDFKNILKKIPITHVNFTGGGEPFLHPNFEKILKIAKDTKKKIAITSNGTLLSKGWTNYLFDLSNIYGITFSIDGATPKTFEDIRDGANYTKVLENLKRLIKIKKRKKSSFPKTKINFMGMRKNIKEFPKLVKIAGKLGVNEVRLLHPIPITKKIDRQHLHRHPQLFRKIRTKTKFLAKKHNLKLKLPPMKPISRICPEPFRKVKVNSGGSIRPCGLFSGDKTENGSTSKTNRKIHYMGESVKLPTNLLNIGDVFEKNFDYSQTKDKSNILKNELRTIRKGEKNETWDAKHYKNLIKETNKPKTPSEICKICPIRLGIGC